MAARRQALREITRSGSQGSSEVRTPNNEHNINFNWLPTPTSPEEEVIRQRGRRQVTQSFLMDCFSSPKGTPRLRSEMRGETPPKTPSKSPNKSRTPQKSSPSSTKILATPTRTSPRKRLNLSQDTPDSDTSGFLGFSRSKRTMTQSKKTKIQRKTPPGINVDVALKALSHNQLIELLQELMTSIPDLKKVVGERLPSPDLQPLEKNLNNLQRNIYKSFPNTRWGSNRDDFCYRRVRTHLEAFKKACIQQGRQLIESQQWGAAVDYVMLAWSYVRHLPDWDESTHNCIKAQCFKTLSTQCMTSVKKMAMDIDEVEDIVERLQEMVQDSETILPCLKYSQSLLEKFK
ncbi:uncharacterized protein LOC106472333 [Limulus polyphemus]|uniref:Uncharacterized protein LOC106472333 n=1 Tax=Limulus polyphemus TaxID=6850 RepID=A0ABM1BTL8_LIMPO|nr:uncharacterized protein LOC106472333 [Limulus polyphemus]XP_022256641.1 uncharacterized protein LOC106472333 [Limulus polyphemus]